MNVKLSRRATRDLARIGAYLRQVSPRGAARVESRIKLCLDLLAEFPKVGVETKRAVVRMLAVVSTPYLLFYRVDASHVTVLKILHRAQNQRF